jgi:hypothetical protein
MACGSLSSPYVIARVLDDWHLCKLGLLSPCSPGLYYPVLLRFGMGNMPMDVATDQNRGPQLATRTIVYKAIEFMETTITLFFTNALTNTC